MKLALIGGGVRSPLFVMSLLRWHERIGITELCMMDIDAQKVDIFSELCRELVRRAGSPFKLTATTDARTALTGARHVVTTIRVGMDEGRVLDERIALKHGVLGQETTGPGGFAMALRSIPTLLEYARLLQEVSPGAWMYNFTNPAGLVAQALQDAGYTRTIGICDSANGAQHAIAEWAGVPLQKVRAEVFGLNHLSWCRSATVDGVDLLPRALADDSFLQKAQPVFQPALVRQVGMYCNEYLYYYYYAEKALQAILNEPVTRGEEIVTLNERLLKQLSRPDMRSDPDKGLRAFFGYDQRRGATYMHYAHQNSQASAELDSTPDFDADIPDEAGEGYAGVALGLMEAIEHNRTLYTGLNVPNRGAIPGMDDTDVVEVSCRVDASGVHPLPTGPIPQTSLSLMRSVKLYETLTVQAVRQRSRSLAIQALMAHPLVLSYPRAQVLVDEYLSAHSQHVGDWH